MTSSIDRAIRARLRGQRAAAGARMFRRPLTDDDIDQLRFANHAAAAGAIETALHLLERVRSSANGVDDVVRRDLPELARAGGLKGD